MIDIALADQSDSVDKRQCGLFHNEARQPTRRKRTSIDIDPVRLDVDFAGWGVTVHDDLAEILARVQKLLSDPEKVSFLLPSELNFGINPGMREKEITAAK